MDGCTVPTGREPLSTDRGQWHTVHGPFKKALAREVLSATKKPGAAW